MPAASSRAGTTIDPNGSAKAGACQPRAYNRAMPVVARLSRERVTLSSPPYARVAHEEPDAVLLGFPASPDKVPWSRLAVDERRRLLDAVAAGDGRLTGSWILVARRGGDLIVRSDYFGTRPLFWREAAGEALVAADAWTLCDDRQALDPEGVADMLIVGHPIGATTIFAGVRATEADVLLTLGPNRVHERRFAPAPPLPSGPSLSDAAAALEHAFDRLYAPYADVPRLLVPLSGGLDSRTLLALAVERGIEVHAATYSQVPGSREELIARRVARTLDVPLTVANAPDDIDQPAAAEDLVRATSGQFSLEHFHGHAARHAAPPEFPVLANGTGGDNVCGGSMLLPGWVSPDALVTTRARQLTLGGGDPQDLAPQLPGVADWPHRLYAHLDRWYEEVGRDPRRQDFMFLRNRTARMNPWGPHAMPRHDYLFPFLDEEVAGVAYGMPEQWHREWNAYRTVLRRRWPKLARIRWAKTGVSPRFFPGPRAKRLIRVRDRLERRPAMFTDPSTYTRMLAPLVARAVRVLAPQLTELGIDGPGLLRRFPPETPDGRLLRLRLATVDCAARMTRG
jgi:asparagine synthetase B (glutamine-hydrolysing)